jgi:uncharacterized membrane protein YeaQ/YmgE (transglycosylase-associated protein family)
MADKGFIDTGRDGFKFCNRVAFYGGRSRMFHILGILIIGLVVGVVAKLLMPGRDPGGFIITILLGIAGSFVGTFIGRAVGLYSEGQSAGFIMSVVGAIVLLAIYHLARRKRPA